MHLRLAILCLLPLVACNSSEHSDMVSAPASEPLHAEELGTVRNLHRYGDVWFAAQPSAADLALFQERGVRTVLDIRHDAETPELDERAIVEGLGMRYVYVPWNGPAELNDAIFDELRDVLATAERPLLFHCASANRVGAIWLAYRALDDGLPLDEARAEAATIGMRTPEYEAKALEYVRSRK
ncbi:MAG: hypothetical protein H6831_12915 [Planctomycetes bacterium]|nr:hypothetical protein [Planctomycetota bacterium]MCB9905299.1 hypothetical protein [Planctomycetota bacterium]